MRNVLFGSIAVLSVLIIVFICFLSFCVARSKTKECVFSASRESIGYFDYARYVHKNKTESRETGGRGRENGNYQGLILFDKKTEGQRDVKKRIALMKRHIAFSHKNVLDLGCNSGYLLFSIKDEIARGIGVDFDPKQINMCSYKKKKEQISNLEFYVFDLRTEPLRQLFNLVSTGGMGLRQHFDVVFLLVVCQKWIYPCTSLLDWVRKHSDVLVIEINGDRLKQKELVEYLQSNYLVVIDMTDKKQCNDCAYRSFFICDGRKCNDSGKSSVFHDSNQNVYVRWFPNSKKKNFLKQVAILKFLNIQQNTNFVPKLMDVNYEKLQYSIPHCGEKLTRQNKPRDFKHKMKEMCVVLQAYGIFHNDFKEKNVVVKNDGDLCLIDWEYADFFPTRDDLCNKETKSDFGE